MNTMKNFDIDKLDDYYDQCISFKCIDILKWINSNLSNDNFNIKYAAQDLYGHYFSKDKRRPKNDCFYYIKYASYSKYMYCLERDYILSPSDDFKHSGSSKNIKRMEDEVLTIRDRIYDTKIVTESDAEYMRHLRSVYWRRIKSITGYDAINYNKFYKYTSKQRGQLYIALLDYKKDMKTLLFILRKVKEGTG